MLSSFARTLLACGLSTCAALAAVPAHADPHVPVTMAFSDVLADLAESATARLWYERREGVDPMDADGHDARTSLHVVVQEDSLGGADVLTVRYPIDGTGIFRTFVGAGLGRAEYYVENGVETTVVPLAFRSTHHALGAVAEFGSEWHASEQLLLHASVRWADVAGDARAVRTDNGPVSAQPVVLGLAVGYRFR